MTSHGRCQEEEEEERGWVQWETMEEGGSPRSHVLYLTRNCLWHSIWPVRGRQPLDTAAGQLAPFGQIQFNTTTIKTTQQFNNSTSSIVSR